jgi:hypothetical protein
MPNLFPEPVPTCSRLECEQVHSTRSRTRSPAKRMNDDRVAYGATAMHVLRPEHEERSHVPVLVLGSNLSSTPAR